MEHKLTLALPYEFLAEGPFTDAFLKYPVLSDDMGSSPFQVPPLLPPSIAGRQAPHPGGPSDGPPDIVNVDASDPSDGVGLPGWHTTRYSSADSVFGAVHREIEVESYLSSKFTWRCTNLGFYSILTTLILTFLSS